MRLHSGYIELGEPMPAADDEVESQGTEYYRASQETSARLDGGQPNTTPVLIVVIPSGPISPTGALNAAMIVDDIIAAKRQARNHFELSVYGLRIPIGL